MRRFSDSEFIVVLCVTAFGLAVAVSFCSLMDFGQPGYSLFDREYLVFPVGSCEVRGGMLRGNSFVTIEVVDAQGRVVVEIPEAYVVKVTEKEVQFVVREGDGKRVPPLAVNNLKLVIVPKGSQQC